jgi:hypothetical protein
MTASTSPRRTPPPALERYVEGVALRLLDAAVAVGLATAVLVGLGDDTTDGVHLQVHPVGGPHDRSLIGWRAPAHWRAIVLLVPPGDVGGHRALVVDRDGSPCSLLVAAHDHKHPARDASNDITADLLARVLGRATAPPTVSPHEVAHAAWLDAVFALATDSAAPHQLTWDHLATLHPAWAGGDSTMPAALAARAAAMGWAELHEALAPHTPGLAGAVATWFDAGSLSRWVLASLAEPDDLLLDLAGLLEPAVWLAVCTVAEAARRAGRRTHMR